MSTHQEITLYQYHGWLAITRTIHKSINWSFSTVLLRRPVLTCSMIRASSFPYSDQCSFGLPNLETGEPLRRSTELCCAWIIYLTDKKWCDVIELFLDPVCSRWIIHTYIYSFLKSPRMSQDNGIWNMS